MEKKKKKLPCGSSKSSCKPIRVSGKIILRPSNGIKYFKISKSSIKGLVWYLRQHIM